MDRFHLPEKSVLFRPANIRTAAASLDHDFFFFFFVTILSSKYGFISNRISYLKEEKENVFRMDNCPTKKSAELYSADGNVTFSTIHTHFPRARHCRQESGLSGQPWGNHGSPGGKVPGGVLLHEMAVCTCDSNGRSAHHTPTLDEASPWWF